MCGGRAVVQPQSRRPAGDELSTRAPVGIFRGERRGQHSLRMDRVTPGQRTFCVGQIDPFALRRILHTGARLCDRVGRVPTRTRIGEPFRAQHDGIVGPP